MTKKPCHIVARQECRVAGIPAPEIKYLIIEKLSLQKFSHTALASESYRLYGLLGIVVPEKAVIRTPYHEGHIAHHIKKGEYSFTDYDWQQFLNYFEKILQE